MIIALIIVGGIYIGSLCYCAFKGRQEIRKTKSSFAGAGSGIGSFLGFLTFSATLFSTFTLMGMPDFFRNHGIGAWIFLGVTDVAMGFIVLAFGLLLKKRVDAIHFESVSKLLNESYGSKLASIVYLIGIFIFLLPYVSIQIRGIAVFLSEVIPGSLDVWIWAIAIMLAMLIYSSIGGLKAIMYSDAVQGIVLLVVTWIVSIYCLNQLGGVEALIKSVQTSNSELLSTPGPKGLFSFQFLLASFLTILLMPISQPQLTNRIAFLKSGKDLKVMSVAVAIFSLLIILPTIVLGLYGAVKYPSLGTPEYLGNILVNEQIAVVGAIAIVGLIAAAMSTADSQLFALGTELKSNLNIKQSKQDPVIKLTIVLFAILAFALALNSTNELVLLARVSFAGTALIAPLVFFAIITKEHLGPEIPLITLLTLVLFLLANLGLLSSNFLGIRIDLTLLAFVTIASFSSYIVRRFVNQ
ncbi:MAG: sodium:solute symporter family protein [Puniceicoccaceae bacterium]